jgi:hypothetical protein
MTHYRLLILTPIVAGALWALFLASPQAGRLAILFFILLLPLILGAAANLKGAYHGKQ